ncbi:response regulator [Deinococcus cellulosilyticus]|uniref:Response regulator n=1 Tax=Deinococcus cellulosilyticus (strain DSM 18568 / NBRC 106333 / KACC 11606 / 5516J-15) TaxID=1223518 RepID=A0A511N8I1_DEIC1|nr:response regulator [Deinococcus cellulosilyticus]GEM48837.1 response regulator [Deinococcus cellulosilyticus NBRC 106333 = KACC 11606]
MKSYKILVADDETSIRTMLEMILSADGHEVISVSDGRETLEYLKNNTPDAILLDVRMPDISGLEICSRVKRVSRLKNVPVILLTAMDDQQTQREAKLARADGIIYKPLSGKNLRTRVRSIIEGTAQGFEPEP